MSDEEPNIIDILVNTIKSIIPSKTSDLTNDSGFLTQHQDISGKANISDLSTVATSGDYDDLSDKPTIPSKISDLTDDSNFVEENELSTVATSGSYTDLSNKPSIPSKTSDLTNDSGFLTQHQDISGKANSSDLSAVATSGSYNDLTNKPSIPNIESVYEITSNKGIASENTMGKLYIEIENDKRDVYYTSDTIKLGYFYFEKDSGKLYVYGNFYDPEKYYYLLAEEYQIFDSFEYDSNKFLWTISKNINYIDDFFAIGISDTEIEGFNDNSAPIYMSPSDDYYYITDYYNSTEYVHDIEDNVSSQYIDIIKDNEYNWCKLDDDVLDNLSINWNNIQNKPSIPTKTSDLTNDSGFLTQHQDISGKANSSDLSTVATTGSYNDLTDTPNIPSPISIYSEEEIVNNGFYLLKEAEIILHFEGTSFKRNVPSQYASVEGLLIVSCDGEATVDWGDGNSITINNGRNTNVKHTYTDGKLEHDIKIMGISGNGGLDLYANVTSITINDISLNDGIQDCPDLEIINLSSNIEFTINTKFNNNPKLNSINVPSNITELGTECFSNTGFSELPLLNVTSLPDRCFKDCENLVSANIPYGVTSIGENCFYGCSNLTSISIPSTVDDLNNNSFSNCPIIDCQLYWEGSEIIEYYSEYFTNNTVFTIPNGQTSNYVAKGYPSDKLVERSE